MALIDTRTLAKDEEGFVYDTTTDEYLEDEDGDYVTEQEVLDHNNAAEDESESEFANAMEVTAGELETKLSRELTGAEIDKLIDHSLATGDTDVTSYYEKATGRSIGNQEDTLDEVMAEMVDDEEVRQQEAESAEYTEDGDVENAGGTE